MRVGVLQTGRSLLFAFVIVAIAWGATNALYYIDRPLQQHGVMTFFLVAVIVAAWRGGVVPAIFAAVLSTLIVAWILPPPYSLRISDPQDVVRLVMFAMLAALICYMHFARERAERSLKESESRLHFSLDCSGVACWDADMKSGTFWKSHNLPAVFGRAESDFATTYEGFFAYIHPEDREFFHLATVKGGKSQRDYEIPHRIICGDGSVRRVNTRGRMYLDGEGHVQRMVGAVFALNEKSPAPAAAGQPAGHSANPASYFV
jgi:PAS domain-containing protein